MQVVIPQHSFITLSSAEAFVFLKPQKRGKGGKKVKAENRERRKKRERKGKAKKASARFLSKYGKSSGYPTAHSLSAGEASARQEAPDPGKRHIGSCKLFEHGRQQT